MLTMSMIVPLTRRTGLFARPEWGLLRRFYVRFPRRAGTAKVDERNSEFSAAAQELLAFRKDSSRNLHGSNQLRWTNN